MLTLAVIKVAGDGFERAFFLAGADFLAGAAALLAGTGFVDAATALDGGLGATVGIIAAANLMPKSKIAQWIVPVAVPALIGMKVDGVVVGTGLVATMVYRSQMI